MVTPAMVEPLVNTPPVDAPVLVAPAGTEPAPVASPVLAPPPITAAPPPPAYTPPSELAVLRQRLAQVEAEKAAQATEATLQQEAQAVRQEALARGLSDEDATWFAQKHYVVARRVSQEQTRLREQGDLLQAKQNAAAHYGRIYGVDPNVLMSADSPDQGPNSMVVLGERHKLYLAQEARLKALERNQVPAQTLDASNGSRAGNIVVTNDNIDKLWVDHETQHPGTPNPYDVPYRKFLNG